MISNFAGLHVFVGKFVTTTFPFFHILQIFVYLFLILLSCPWKKPRHFCGKAGVYWGSQVKKSVLGVISSELRNKQQFKRGLSLESSKVIRTQPAGKGLWDVRLEQRYQKGPMEKAGRFDSPAWCAFEAEQTGIPVLAEKGANIDKGWCAEDWPFCAIALLWNQGLLL